MTRPSPRNRPLVVGPLVVGLTGSIGMGKSTVSKMFARLGAATLSADAVVHELLGPNGAAVSKVARLFPQTLQKGAINRQKLAQALIGAPALFEKLEGIIHPLVWKAERAFIKQARQDGRAVVVLDIPLLFETGSEKRMDVVLCVHAKASVQKERVLKRPHMTAAKLRSLLARQMPVREKKARADLVIPTDVPPAETRRIVKKIWDCLMEIQR